MQHAGLQYGQGAANSHQSPPFAHADISFSKQQQQPQQQQQQQQQQLLPNGGNTTSSLRQFRKKDGFDKSPTTTDLNTSITEHSHIARVAPQNHYPARPNDYYRYHSQYPDYNTSYKEPIAQVKYSEIAETPSQVLQHVDHLPQKHKEPHKEFMDMCNLGQQTHMKQNYTENLARQQNYPPDAVSMHHHQYLHKEPQVHPNYKPESQYQQYPHLAKYNMPTACRKYPPPPPPENDFLAKLQRINPSMAKSIMSDHHIRESQANAYSNQMYPQNQRYYPTHLQNNYNYHMPYNYPSCNYPRPNQTQYPAPERSVSPRMNYTPQKISPVYNQYNPPEYAQHYQHRRTSVPQEYYQQSCRTNSYVPTHQISPEPNDNRASSNLRHFIENWAEEEGPQEIFKENVRIHNEGGNEQVFVINSTELPQCLENVSLVPTENGQYIIKSGSLDNSVVRIKETTENNGERTVNLQIVEATPKPPDCMMEAVLSAVEEPKINEEPLTVPYLETSKDCDEATNKNDQIENVLQELPIIEEDTAKKNDSVIVSNEVSVIKDMPLIEEDHPQNAEPEKPEAQDNELENDTPQEKEILQDAPELPTDNHITTTTKRTQRIFSVDDIINKIGNSSIPQRRNSLQETLDDQKDKSEDTTSAAEEPEDDPPAPEENHEEMEYTSAISIEDDSVILEIGGALVQLNINHFNGTKVLSVLPLSDSLVIDVNGNYQNSEVVSMEEGTVSEEKIDNEIEATDEGIEEKSEEPVVVQPVEEGVPTSDCQSEVVIGEESVDNDVFIDLDITNEERISFEEDDDVEEKSNDRIEMQKEIQVVPEKKEPEVELVQEVKTIKELEEEVEPAEVVKKKEKKVVVEEKKKLKINNEGKTRKSSPSKKIKIEEKKSSDEKLKLKKVQQKSEEEDPKSVKKYKSTEDEVLKSTKKIKSVKDEDDLKLTKTSRSTTDEEDFKATKKYRSTNEEEDLKVKKNKGDAEEEDLTIVRNSKTTNEEEDLKSTKKIKGGTKEEEMKLAKKVVEEDDLKLVIKKNKIIEMEEDESYKTEKPETESEKTEEKPLVVSTKAAKKLYTVDPFPKKVKPKPEDKVPKVKKEAKKAQLEETVNKIKSLKEKELKKEPPKPKSVKKVTFSLDPEVREISKEEMDRKKLSLEEYNTRKRKAEEKIMEDTVTSSEDINDQVVEQVEQSIENAIKDSVLKKISDTNSWEDDPDSPKTLEKEVVPKRCIIDVNEFNIKPIESVSTPSPVSSSQFSYHSEDDSLQVYKEVVDSKLNSLNIKIPKVKPKPVDKFSALLERFLNKSSLNCSELEKVKKIIEFKRKIEEKQLTYEVRAERDYKDLKLHIKKIGEKKPKKRFRNLYTKDTSSEDSDSDKAVGDYSVYQRSSQQGVPKLIFKRNSSGLPQPFVKLERSQAVELLAKKRKMY